MACERLMFVLLTKDTFLSVTQCKIKIAIPLCVCRSSECYVCVDSSKHTFFFAGTYTVRRELAVVRVKEVH